MSKGDAVADGKANVPGKPGTGRQKWSSVPVESWILFVGRVQENKSGRLYP